MSIKEKITNGKEKTMTWVDEHKKVIVGSIITGGVAILTCCGAYVAGIIKGETSQLQRMGGLADIWDDMPEKVTYIGRTHLENVEGEKFKYPVYILISKEDDELQ